MQDGSECNKNITFFHSKLLLDNSASFTSRMKDLCQILTQVKFDTNFDTCVKSHIPIFYDRSTPLIRLTDRRPVTPASNAWAWIIKYSAYWCLRRANLGLDHRNRRIQPGRTRSWHWECRRRLPTTRTCSSSSSSSSWSALERRRHWSSWPHCWWSCCDCG